MTSGSAATQPGAATPQAIELARRALDLAATDPRAASDAAELVLESSALTPEAEAVARRALGLVARERNDLRSSAEQLHEAIRVAEAAGLRHVAAEARMSLAPTLAMQGDGDAAMAECDRAAVVLTGLARARLEAQRAALLEFLGRPDEALVTYTRALPVLRRSHDRLWEARALHNRGLLYLKRGEIARARTELAAADGAFADLGSHATRIHALDHLARLEALTGELPAALARFAQIDEILKELDAVDPLGLIDRCAVLLSARLGEEAKAAARLAVDESERAGDEHHLAQARLALAEALLLTGEPVLAVSEASTAAAAFRRQHAAQWAARAGLVAVQARWASGERSHRLLTLARASAAELDRARWTDAAAEARLLAGQVAIELGRPRVARPELARAARVRGASPAPTRIRAWHAIALLRQLDGNRRGVTSALRTGLRIVDAHRSTLGATELRARAAGHGAELAALGLRRAVADGSASEVLIWAERFRAGTLSHAPAPPAQDPALLRDLAELRRLATEIEAAALAGDDIAPLRRRQVALEAAVSRLVRTVQGRTAAFTRTIDIEPLTSTLADRVLVELVEVDGWLHTVVVRAGNRPTLTPLASAPSVLAELDGARFALRRLAHGRGSAASLAAARAALTESAAGLQSRLLDPIRDELADHPLVVVPTGALHVLPWSTLPALSGRHVTISPSAGLWLDSERQARTRSRRRRVVLVAGPGLPGAGPEIAALARRYRGDDLVRLTGRNADAAAVTSALDGARLAHVAAHGRFRADNPLFSALELVDGPLTVHDLEGVRRPPDTLILSACDSGLSSVHPGDELLGLAAGLLALGTRTLVVSVLPVPDQATRALMVDLHDRLRAGAGPAEALAGAQAAAFATGDDAALAAAASFVCVGRGESRRARRPSS